MSFLFRRSRLQGGTLVSRVPSMATFFRSSGLDGISAPSHRRYSQWIRPDFRLGFAGTDCKMTSDKEAWMRGSGSLRHSDPDLVTWKTGRAVPAGGMGRDASVATKERITCLCGLWGQTDATSGRRALALNSSSLHRRYCMNVWGVCVKSWNTAKQKQAM